MQRIKGARGPLLAWVCGALAVLFVLALTHATVVSLWEAFVVNSKVSDRAETRAAGIGEVVDSTAKLQLRAFESEVRSCMKPAAFEGSRFDDYKPNWLFPLKGDEAERFVLDRERECVSRVVSRVLIVRPEAGSAIGHVAIEAGYSVSEDIRAMKPARTPAPPPE